MHNKALVTVEWLSQHLHDPDVVILDASMKPVGFSIDTTTDVIPGALRFDIERVFSQQNHPLPHTMPGPEQFEPLIQAMGIDHHSQIVIYDNAGVYSSPRAWWMFKAMGFAHVAVLDGGLPAWLAAGLPSTQQYAEASSRSQGIIKFSAESVVTCQQVLSAIEQADTRIIDARSAGRFTGVDAEPRPGLRCGHIPGALNIPFTECIKQGKVRSQQVLQTLFSNAGVASGDKLIFSCGSGVTACVPLLAAAICGFQDLALYDGSWAEWGADPALPVQAQNTLGGT